MLLLILVGVGAFVSLLLDYDRFFRFHKVEEEEEGGPFPSEWFMQQRLWPNDRISTDEYLSAVAQADRLSAHRLDDPPQWEDAGPANIGGRVTDIVGDPADEQIFYVAAASGGVFKTVNGGTTWTPIFDSQPSLSIGALALSPDNSDELYVATGEANAAGFTYFGTGVYRSTNAGESWSHLGLTETKFIARIVVDPANTQKLFVAAMGDQYAAGTARGIYISTNGGSSWERTLFVNDSTGASDVIVHPQNPNIVLAATWQRMRSASMRAVGGRGSGIHRSTDGGQTWLRITDGLPAPANDVGRIGLAVCESSPNVMYAIYADDPGNFAGIYKSTDTGESWSRVNDGDLSQMYSNFGWYFGNIRVRPDNPNHVFALGQTLWRSTDGGQNWSQIGATVHVDFHALWYLPGNPQRMLVGSDGGVFRSTNNGNAFTFLNGLAINQFYAASVDFQLPQRRYGGVQDNGTLRTLTGATDDWDQIHGGDGFYALVDPTNSQRIWAEYQWGWLERSDNGGSSWDVALNGIDENERTNWATPVLIDPVNPQRLYYGAMRLYRTDNRGNAWDNVSDDLTDGPHGGNLSFGTITTIDVSPLNNQIIIVGTDDAKVWITTDGGAHWLDRSAGIPQRWVTRVVCDPRHVRRFYVTVSGFRNAEVAAQLFVSDADGLHWRNISGGLPDGPLNDVVAEPTIEGRLYVASDFGCFVTPDLGDHWSVLGENLPRVPVIDLVLHPSGELTAATYGRSMFKADLADLSLNRAPEISLVSPLRLDTVLQSASIEFRVQGHDPDGLPVQYRFMVNGAAAGDSVLTVQFDSARTTYEIVGEVSDGSLNTRSYWYVYVQPASAAPEPSAPVANALLVSAFPNPFNATTTLEYTMPAAGTVTVSLFDETGRLVRQLMTGHVPRGTQRLQVDAQGLGSGIYFATVRSESAHKVQKLLLVK